MAIFYKVAIFNERDSMNNIHEDDWADDSWSRHSGMFEPTQKPEKESDETVPSKVYLEEEEQ